jgi:hypothetical protein
MSGKLEYRKILRCPNLELTEYQVTSEETVDYNFFAYARWEKFYLNPFPSGEQLQALRMVVGVEAQRLREMLPPAGVGMKLEPIRLCGACYAESPCHRIEWQFKRM